MKHVNSFHGSITALLTARGLDSKAVLNACNAYRGSVKADPSKTKVTSETKMSGKVTDKADGRKLSFTDKETYKTTTEKGNAPAPGQLIGMSDEITKLSEKYGFAMVLTEFPADVEEWLETKASSFAPVQGCELPPVQAEPVSA